MATFEEDKGITSIILLKDGQKKTIGQEDDDNKVYWRLPEGRQFIGIYGYQIQNADQIKINAIGFYALDE